MTSSIIVLLFFLSSCFSGSGPQSTSGTPGKTQAGTAPVYGYKAIRTYPHDSGAFTQGLVFENGFFYESTGLYGKSTLRKVEMETGKVLQVHNLPEQYFGEGMTIYENRIIQLTWQSNLGFVYDRDTFKILRNFSYPYEGWGITHDGKLLIVSDGTSILHFLDPATFSEVKRIEVRDEKGPVMRLNELEYINGEIWANVWQTDYIMRISPETGRVTGKIDLKGLLAGVNAGQPVDVLNGIAYDAKNGRLFVTGKLWPLVFEIEVVVRERNEF